MATIKPTYDSPSGDQNLRRVTWADMANGDVGEAVGIDKAEWSDRLMQVTGTFGSGGSVSGEGTLDGANFATLTQPANTALTFTAAGIKAVVEAAASFRPHVTAGDGTTALTVTLLMRRIPV